MRKKMMKKAMALLTGMILAASLIACGSRHSGSNTPETRQEREDVMPESIQESPALSEKGTVNQSDAAQAGQETTGQTEQQAENSTDTSAVETEVKGAVLINAGGAF